MTIYTFQNYYTLKCLKEKGEFGSKIINDFWSEDLWRYYLNSETLVYVFISTDETNIRDNYMMSDYKIELDETFIDKILLKFTTSRFSTINNISYSVRYALDRSEIKLSEVITYMVEALGLDGNFIEMFCKNELSDQGEYIGIISSLSKDDIKSIYDINAERYITLEEFEYGETLCDIQ